MSGQQLEVMTPEGIPLRFELAPLAERAAAFTIDALILLATTFALGLLVTLAGGQAVFVAFFIFASFVLRSFYFVAFELLRQGATPGKRARRIRVVDARGGPLTARAVFARNVTRELELFLPLVAVFAPEMLYEDAPAPVALLSAAWLLVFALLPLLNRQRMRVGDLIAGTRVVAVPEAVLLAEMGERAARYTFTADQLSHYGNYELHVLEDLLRRRELSGPELSGPEPSMLAHLEDVSHKIRRRIGWEGPVETLPFLEDFYVAQRAHLERELLFGRRHADKTAARAARGS